jgi:hypothetical protein
VAQSLRDILSSSITSALESNNEQIAREQLPPFRQPNPQPPRSYASPMDSYENEVGYDSPFNHLAPGATRPMWQIPDIALTHTPVSTLVRAGIPNSTQTAQIVGGVMGGVVAPASGWAPVPNMQLRVSSTGPLVLTASCGVQSTSASDAIQFAFYRDGNQIGQIFTQTTSSVAGMAGTISLSTIDQPPTGSHIYALYWKAGSGTLSSTGTARSLFSMNLTPS